MAKLLDQTFYLKLCISRDVHSEFMRKSLGKTHYETVFGDHSNFNSYSCSHSSSLDSYSSSNNIMSVFEFCLLCDATPLPIPGSPQKRTSRKGNSDASKKTFSSLLTELNEYSVNGVHAEDFGSHSSHGSPPKSDYAAPIDKKTNFDGMIRLEKIEKLENSRNTSDDLGVFPPNILINIGSASTRVDESAFLNIPLDQCISSSLSSPTVAGSSSISRSASQEQPDHTQIIRDASNESMNDSSVMTELLPSRSSLKEESNPIPSIGLRHPIKAKRNPKIERMISDAATKARAGSPRNALALTRSTSGQHSASFYDSSVQFPLSYSTEGIAACNKLPSGKPKPFLSLFPLNANQFKRSTSSTTPIKSLNSPSNRLTNEDLISNRKLMARKMREVSFIKLVPPSSSISNYIFLFVSFDSFALRKLLEIENLSLESPLFLSGSSFLSAAAVVCLALPLCVFSSIQSLRSSSIHKFLYSFGSFLSVARTISFNSNLLVRDDERKFFQFALFHLFR